MLANRSIIPSQEQDFSHTHNLLFASSILRSSNDFGYRVNVDPNEKYAVKIGLAESQNIFCTPNGRRFDLLVGENKVLFDVNAYKLAGNRCKYAVDLVFRDVEPKSFGELVVMAKKGPSAGGPFMACMEVSLEGSS